MRANFLFVSLTLAASSFLSGCTFVHIAPPPAEEVQLSGVVYGGGLPVSGAHVYLYAANTDGNAGPGIQPTMQNASVSLLQAAPNTSPDANGNYYTTTTANGAFNLTGDHAACILGEQMYLYTSGGNGGDGMNAAAGMLSAIGGCTPTYPNSTTHVHVDELTTIAAAYSLAGFASDATHIADDEHLSSGTAAFKGATSAASQQDVSNTTSELAITGMANAFSNAANLVTLATGSPLSTTPGGNGAVPLPTINTIGNLLADCVQSSGPASLPCTSLFTFTGTPSGGDTATAAILLAQNPVGVHNGISVTTLFNGIPPNASFSPGLTSAPNDFTIAISYSGTNINYPDAIAVDANGSVWIANFSGNSIAEFAGTGAAYTETDYYDASVNQPIGIAIDNYGSAWVANSNSNSITQFAGAGTTYTATPYTGGGLNLPYSIAVDGHNNVWVANLVGGSVSEFTGSGVEYSGTAVSGGNINLPFVVTVDGSNDIWIGNYGDSSLTELALSSGTYTGANDAGGNTASPVALAVDASGSIWVANNANNSISQFAGSSATYTGTNFTGGGVNTPSGIAVDGAGNIWVANSGGKSISEFSNAGVALSPTANGFTGTVGTIGGANGPLQGPNGIAVDGSGNVWVADSSNTAVEFVGAATPVVAPLAEGILYKKLGARP